MNDQLVGTWQMVRGELRGEFAPEMVTTHTQLRLTETEYAVSYGGEVADRGTYESQALADGDGLTLHGVEGPNAGKRIPCLFQLKRDLLRVCFGLDGVQPDTFSAPAGAERYVVMYRRVG